MELQDHEIRTLIEASARGHAESCRKLYELLIDKVYGYVRYRTRTTEHATDLTQDVFIDFFATVSNFTYQSRAQFYAYVFLITRRKLSKYYEALKKRNEGEAVTFDEESMTPILTEGMQGEIAEVVALALSHLDAQTQEIITLHHWSQYTFGEIAEMLSMTESAVRVRHHRALPVLAQYLKEIET